VAFDSNSVTVLAEFLRDSKPALWIGAGASMQAGYPSTEQITQTLMRKMGKASPPDLDFRKAADEFVKEMGRPALADEVAKLLSKPRQPTTFHAAIARLCRERRLSTIITTNYDNLVERTLDHASVRSTVYSPGKNDSINLSDAVRILKLHGSQEDWLSIVLSGASYEDYQKRYGWLLREFDQLCRTEWLVFAGCSLRDPRLVEWINQLTSDQRDRLKPWLAVMTEQDERLIDPALKKTRLRTAIVSSYDDLELVWQVAAASVANEDIGWKSHFVQSEVRRIRDLLSQVELVISRDKKVALHHDYVFTLEAQTDSLPLPKLSLPPGESIRLIVPPGNYRFKLSYVWHSPGYVSGTTVIPSRDTDHSTREWSGILNPGTYTFNCRQVEHQRKGILKFFDHVDYTNVLDDPTYRAWSELLDAGIEFK